MKLLKTSDRIDPHSNPTGSAWNLNYFYQIQIEIFFIEFESDYFASDCMKFASYSDYTAILSPEDIRKVDLVFGKASKHSLQI